MLNIEQWCAKIYERSDYSEQSGWVITTGITSSSEMTKRENNSASSIKVQRGCTLKVFDDYNKEGLSKTIKTDTEWLSDINDKISSFMCHCNGMYHPHKS